MEIRIIETEKVSDFGVELDLRSDTYDPQLITNLRILDGWVSDEKLGEDINQ